MLKATGALLALLALAGLGLVMWNEKEAKEYAAQTAQRQALQEAETARQRELSLEQERQRKHAEAERERQKQQANQAAHAQVAALEARRQSALRRVTPIATEISCTYPRLGCDAYRINVTVANKSDETISNVSLGWVFLPPKHQTCPSTTQTRRSEQVVLRPGDTTVFNLDGHDGPAGLSRYCIFVTDVKLVP